MSFQDLRRVVVFSISLAVSIASIPKDVARAQPAGDSQRYALLVGVNQYEKRNFPDLDYAESDMQALSSELTKLGFTAVLMQGSAKGELRATRENINAQLDRLLKRVTKRDVVLLAFSGHGQQYEVETKQADGSKLKHEDAFFCPVDAVKNDPATLFSLNDLIDRRLAEQGGKNLVLVDACRDAPKDPGRGVKGVQGRSITLPDDTSVLFSCRAGQESFESEKLKHGLFTHCVLDGLRGGAADPEDGTITWTSLANHVERSMARVEMHQYISQGREQEPLLAGNVGRTVLARLGGMEGIELGQMRDDNGPKMKLLWCPPGKFKMGSPTSEKKRLDDENQVEVTLTKGFWLAQTPMTRAQWRAVDGTETIRRTGTEDEAADSKATDDLPINHILPNTLDLFFKRFNANERKAQRLRPGWKYTVPTEAQWEYAARAGTTTAYSFGDDPAELGKYAWFGEKTPEMGGIAPHPVAKKKPNPWGFYDMHGNVVEWIADDYQEKLPGGINPFVASGTTDLRWFRGGRTDGPAEHARSAYRHNADTDWTLSTMGLRVALVPEK